MSRLPAGESLVLFHWSPTVRRKSIQRFGLEPGHWDTERLWKPPYVAYALDPLLAWRLSGWFRHKPGTSWDLWQTHTDHVRGFEVVPFDDGSPKEIRVYQRIYKRHVTYLASREVR